MTLLDRFNKQPAEIKKYQIEYAEWLAEGQTITNVDTDVIVINDAATDVGEPTMTITNGNIIGGTVYGYTVNSGTSGKRYKVTFQATTSDAQLVESEIEFKVNDT